MCLYIHECHMAIISYFFYAQTDLAQWLTNALCMSIGKINIYVDLDKKTKNKKRTKYTDTNWEDPMFAM